MRDDAPAADPPERGTRTTRFPGRLPFVVAAALVVLADQASKEWAVRALADGPIDLVGSLRLRLVFNDGAAFSLIAGRTTLVALLAASVTVVVVVLGLRAERRWWGAALGLIAGGALGNLVDRAARDGEGFLGGAVVDFVDLQWYPVWNLADAAIVIGVGLALLLSLRGDDVATTSATTPLGDHRDPSDHSDPGDDGARGTGGAADR